MWHVGVADKSFYILYDDEANWQWMLDQGATTAGYLVCTTDEAIHAGHLSHYSDLAERGPYDSRPRAIAHEVRYAFDREDKDVLNTVVAQTRREREQMVAVNRVSSQTPSELLDHTRANDSIEVPCSNIGALIGLLARS